MNLSRKMQSSVNDLTQQQAQYLQDNYVHDPDEVLAAHLGIEVTTVKDFLKRAGCRRRQICAPGSKKRIPEYIARQQPAKDRWSEAVEKNLCRHCERLPATTLFGAMPACQSCHNDLTSKLKDEPAADSIGDKQDSMSTRREDNRGWGRDMGGRD